MTVSTPALLAAQRAIRRRLKIDTAEVKRARLLAQSNGCSNLIEPRPRPADFHPVRLISISTNEKGTLYRFTLSLDDVTSVLVSESPIRVREGAMVPFAIVGGSRYVIDENGAMQELYVEGSYD